MHSSIACKFDFSEETFSIELVFRAGFGGLCLLVWIETQSILKLLGNFQDSKSAVLSAHFSPLFHTFHFLINFLHLHLTVIHKHFSGNFFRLNRQLRALVVHELTGRFIYFPVLPIILILDMMTDELEVSPSCPHALRFSWICDHTVNTIKTYPIIRINLLNFMKLRIIYDHIDLLPAYLRELLHLLDECFLSTVFFYRV